MRNALLLGLLLLSGTTDSLRAEELRQSLRPPTPAESRREVESLLLASPYRISPGARAGAIRYRLATDDPMQWNWPETSEQHVERTDQGVTITICKTCGHEVKPDDRELRRNLAGTPWLEIGHHGVRALARAARSGSVDRKMDRLVVMVQRRLSGPIDYSRYDSARRAYNARKGDCTEFALLLAAAARARDIPTRVVGGLAYGSRFVGRKHAFAPHMWVQAWDGKRWKSYDAGLGAFDSGHLALAVGDGSPASFRGIKRAIRGLRIESAEGILPDSGKR